MVYIKYKSDSLEGELHTKIKTSFLLSLSLGLVLFVSVLAGSSGVATAQEASLEDEFQAAADEYNVPKELAQGDGLRKHPLGDAPTAGQRLRAERDAGKGSPRVARQLRHNEPLPEPLHGHAGQGGGPDRALRKKS